MKAKNGSFKMAQIYMVEGHCGVGGGSHKASEPEHTVLRCGIRTVRSNLAQAKVVHTQSIL
jgi:hypothetical protein